MLACSVMACRAQKWSQRMDRDRIFGGSAMSTVIRLVLLSIIVGIVFSALGINPANIVDRLRHFLRGIYDLGFGLIEWVVPYFLLGAVVVIPVWIAARVIGAFRRHSDDKHS
jgi:Na+/H+-dicarboxylate symporter